MLHVVSYMNILLSESSIDDDSFSYIYTSLIGVNQAIEERRKNKKLMQKIEDFFGPKMFPPLAKKPHAVLSRSIASPNMEMLYFLELAEEIELEPLILEYPDKFVAKNVDKYHLCKLYLLRKFTDKPTRVVNTLKIVDFNQNEGKMFNKIKTLWGDSIINVHHKMLHSVHPYPNFKVVDFRKWFNQSRRLSEHYYLYFLTLFVCHGVLFENFISGDKEELAFLHEKVLPSFDRVYQKFGVKPLIYPLIPFKQEKDLYWHSYPESIKKMLDEKFLT